MPFRQFPRKLTWPPGAGTNRTRIVAGADTPQILRDSFDIEVALLFYVVYPPSDPNAGLEAGYFFIGVSNDNGTQSMPTLLNGEVQYPTPGDPSSPTQTDVKINYRSVMFPSTTPTDMVYHLVVLAAFGGRLAFESGSGIRSVIPGTLASEIDCLLFTQSGGLATVDVSDPTDFSIHARSQPWGLVGSDVLASNSAAVGAEAIVQTITSPVVREGRAYRFNMVYCANPSAANASTTVRIRKTNIAGGIRASIQVPTFAIGQLQQVEVSTLIRNDSGADISDDAVLTLQQSAGNVTQTQAANRLRRFELWDIGSSADWPNALQW